MPFVPRVVTVKRWMRALLPFVIVAVLLEASLIDMAAWFNIPGVKAILITVVVSLPFRVRGGDSSEPSGGA